LFCQTLVDDEVLPCVDCNTIQGGGYYCIKCGKELRSPPINNDDFVCPECDYYHDPEDIFCRNCGYDLGNDAYNQYQKRIVRCDEDGIKELHCELSDKLEKIKPGWLEMLNDTTSQIITKMTLQSMEDEELKKLKDESRMEEIANREKLRNDLLSGKGE